MLTIHKGIALISYLLMNHIPQPTDSKMSNGIAKNQTKRLTIFTTPQWNGIQCENNGNHIVAQFIARCRDFLPKATAQNFLPRVKSQRKWTEWKIVANESVLQFDCGEKVCQALAVVARGIFSFVLLRPNFWAWECKGNWDVIKGLLIVCCLHCVALIYGLGSCQKDVINAWFLFDACVHCFFCDGVLGDALMM